MVSQVTVVAYALISGLSAVILLEIGLNLGWVYL